MAEFPRQVEILSGPYKGWRGNVTQITVAFPTEHGIERIPFFPEYLKVVKEKKNGGRRV